MSFLPPIADVADRRPAGLTARVVSHMLDVSVQTLVQALVAAAFAWREMLALAEDLAALAGSTDVAASAVAAVEDVLAGRLLLSVVLAWMAGGVIETVLTVRFGGSVGKLALGLEIVETASGARPGWRRVAARWLGLGWAAPAGLLSPAAQVVPFAGYALAWFDPHRRALHDRLSGTVVVVRRPRPEGSTRVLDGYFAGPPSPPVSR